MRTTSIATRPTAPVTKHGSTPAIRRRSTARVDPAGPPVGEQADALVCPRPDE
jgi:uncharacterized Zn-binding protein involved in type VI secretion